MELMTEEERKELEKHLEKITEQPVDSMIERDVQGDIVAAELILEGYEMQKDEAGIKRCIGWLNVLHEQRDQLKSESDGLKDLTDEYLRNIKDLYAHLGLLEGLTKAAEITGKKKKLRDERGYQKAAINHHTAVDHDIRTEMARTCGVSPARDEEGYLRKEGQPILTIAGWKGHCLEAGTAKKQTEYAEEKNRNRRLRQQEALGSLVKRYLQLLEGIEYNRGAANTLKRVTTTLSEGFPHPEAGRTLEDCLYSLLQYEEGAMSYQEEMLDEVKEEIAAELGEKLPGSLILAVEGWRKPDKKDDLSLDEKAEIKPAEVPDRPW